jgi:hypothetical protein
VCALFHPPVIELVQRRKHLIDQSRVLAESTDILDWGKPSGAMDGSGEMELVGLNFKA